jgi:hypothetical protein
LIILWERKFTFLQETDLLDNTEPGAGVETGCAEVVLVQATMLAGSCLLDPEVDEVLLQCAGIGSS